ncbi:hypothetical protein PIB30_083289 [Stylosanthes scabra]|uniref:Uncharacterized protein n=1 Tax=Stylosanthes scabra TaxID=79078 RepID=A0ABU6RSE4_9FABA|nr:hypothetical protein [Stylosanthes scabra]
MVNLVRDMVSWIQGVTAPVRLFAECIPKRSQGHVRSHEGTVQPHGALFLTSWLLLVFLSLLMPFLVMPEIRAEFRTLHRQVHQIVSSNKKVSRVSFPQRLMD